MKTKLTDILDVLNTLRDYLTEAHQEELDSAHHGDDGGCSYCLAIAKADGILALNSDPDEHASLASVLRDAEQFVSGFEGDEAQEGIDGDDGLLARLRDAVAFYGGEQDVREVAGKPTVAQMRQALVNTLDSINGIMAAEFMTTEMDEAHVALESVGLDLCRAGGWDWEDDEALVNYCHKATSQECAQETLAAFDRWAGKNL